VCKYFEKLDMMVGVALQEATIFHQRLKGGLLVALTTGQHEGERLALSLSAHMNLCIEPATTSAQRHPFVPPFAPAAC
jgi:hypothetical protein